jgi:hypothetical protein
MENQLQLFTPEQESKKSKFWWYDEKPTKPTKIIKRIKTMDNLDHIVTMVYTDNPFIGPYAEAKLKESSDIDISPIFKDELLPL